MICLITPVKNGFVLDVKKDEETTESYVFNNYNELGDKIKSIYGTKIKLSVEKERFDIDQVPKPHKPVDEAQIYIAEDDEDL